MPVPATPTLDLAADPVELTAVLVDIPSVSRDEALIADAVDAALRGVGTFDVVRDGNTIIARTDRGLSKRVILAGHLDTVPIADNVPSRREGDLLYGCGTSDMKSGVAVMLHVASTIQNEPTQDLAYDLTVVAYDCEEIESEANGLGRVAREHPEWLAGDLAIVLEPTSGQIEVGCQGVLRFRVTTRGRRAHAARSWLGHNAIHAAGDVLRRLSEYQPRTVVIDGCEYREGMNAVLISGGVATNVIPDECAVDVSFRYAPDRTPEQALRHVEETFPGYDIAVRDSSPAAPPGLSLPAVRHFITSTGAAVEAKYGWTDVARFTQLGIPALNFGPGDPGQAHQRGEYVDTREITRTTAALRAYLTSVPQE